MEGKKSRINMITDLVDRISPLPDFILGHILSFLPTDEAVATSILSKRWKFAWVTVHSLDFDNPQKTYDYVEEKEKDFMEFVRFVNRVLLLNDAGSLNKFSLLCRPGYNSPFSTQITSWINTAITRNVHDLYLSVGGAHMPTSLFSCDSLRSLDLYGFISIDDTTTVCLPRLESLKIHRVSFESEETCENLIRGCPLLHYLELFIEGYADDDADVDYDFTCTISSASLKRLVLYLKDTSKLKLKAPSLEHLRLFGYITEIFVEKGLSSLVEADFDISLDEHDVLNNSIVEAVRAFDCAKFLSLSADVMQALSRATISLSTDFKRLAKLTFRSRTYCSSLQDFIQSSNNLEVLIIDQYSDNLHSPPRWTTLVEVPRCFSNSLKKVRLNGYEGLEDEREMICYMLKHGSVLEVMQISCSNMGDREKLELLQDICDLPRKSPACKVQFCVWPSKRQFKLFQ